MPRKDSYVATINFGAICLFIAAFLLACWAISTALSGYPESDSTSIRNWASSNSLTIALSNECLFFGTFALIPGLLALTMVAWPLRPILSTIGASSLAGGIVTLLVVNVFLGRLVYPTFGIGLDPQLYSYTFSVYYGGLHAFDLMMVVAVLTFGFALTGKNNRMLIAVASVLASISEFLVAYPWFFSPYIGFTLRICLFAWLVIVGVDVLRKGNTFTKSSKSGES